MMTTNRAVEMAPSQVSLSGRTFCRAVFVSARSRQVGSVPAATRSEVEGAFDDTARRLEAFAGDFLRGLVERLVCLTADRFEVVVDRRADVDAAEVDAALDVRFEDFALLLVDTLFGAAFFDVTLLREVLRELTLPDDAFTKRTGFFARDPVEVEEVRFFEMAMVSQDGVRLVRCHPVVPRRAVGHCGFAD